MDQLSAIERVKKLRELSNSSNANEAANAAKIADRLCEQYRITEAHLKPEAKEEPTRSDQYIYESGRVTRWKSDLLSFLGAHYGCSVIVEMTTKNNRKYSQYRLVGTKSDMEIVGYMFGWLNSEIERVTILNCKGKGHVASNSYATGMVVGIRVQMTESKKEVREEAVKDGKTTALVALDSRLEEAKKSTHKFYPSLVDVKESRNSKINTNFFNDGFCKGKDMSLSKALPK